MRVKKQLDDSEFKEMRSTEFNLNLRVRRIEAKPRLEGAP